MNTAQSQLTIRRVGAQALALVAVAALGLSLGRWVLPATDSAPAGVYQLIEASTNGGASDIMERKFAQMDAADARVRPATGVTGSASNGGASDIMERKFAQMDAADARVRPATGVTGSASNSGASDIMERKFAQMDAQDQLAAR